MAATAISGLTALTAPAVADELIVVDDSAGDNKSLALSFLVRDTGGTGAIVTGAYTLTLASSGTLGLGGFTLTVPATGTAALLGTANVFTAAQDITLNATGDTQAALYLDNDWGYGASTAGAAIEFRRVGVKTATIHSANENLASSNGNYIAFSTLNPSGAFGERGRITGAGHLLIGPSVADSAQLTVQSDAAGTIGLVVNSAATPSANLAEFQNNGTAKLKLGVEGILDYTGTMGNSSKNPTADAPADWVQVAIGGTTYYLPAYAA